RLLPRFELASWTCLAPSTCTLPVDALLASGLIGPSGEAVSTGGRPPTTFCFRPGARVVLAADLGATHTRMALTDMSGAVLAEDGIDLEIAAGPETVLDWVVERGRTLLQRAGRPEGQLLGIGLGPHGSV